MPWMLFLFSAARRTNSCIHHPPFLFSPSGTGSGMWVPLRLQTTQTHRPSPPWLPSPLEVKVEAAIAKATGQGGRTCHPALRGATPPGCLPSAGPCSAAVIPCPPCPIAACPASPALPTTKHHYAPAGPTRCQEIVGHPEVRVRALSRTFKGEGSLPTLQGTLFCKGGN